MTLSSNVEVACPDWVRMLRRYFLFSAAGHLAWETAHIPLYTIWLEGTWGEIAFAILHCTGGDLLIAMSTLLLALFLVGTANWPQQRRRGVLATAIAFGVAYTFFSEWLNIVVRAAWAYRDIMPVVPILDTGLTPLLQWIVVPMLAYVAALTLSFKRHPDAEARR
jgi:hypothetical protein